MTLSSGQGSGGFLEDPLLILDKLLSQTVSVNFYFSAQTPLTYLKLHELHAKEGNMQNCFMNTVISVWPVAMFSLGCPHTTAVISEC